MKKQAVPPETPVSRAGQRLKTAGAAGILFLFFVFSIAGSWYFLSEFEERTDPAVEASLFNQVTPLREEPERLLIPVGTAFGIKLYTDGVIVASLANVTTEAGSFCPAKDAGIRPGDCILEAEGQKVKNNDHLSSILRECGSGGENTVRLKVKRGEELFETTLHLVSDGQRLLGGMWIRDSAAGIGTLTYYDPASGEFGGLGHGICDVDTKVLMNIREGEPAGITITSVEKGKKNAPGKLNGYFSGEGALGSLLENRETGIYGTLNAPPQGEAVPAAGKEEIAEGEAEILAAIDDTGPKRYRVEIEKIFPEERTTKNMVIRVTDEELLERSGGIVQGMSGCPILQNGKLVGAVTHVFLRDPTRGYGIFIENMLAGRESAQSEQNAQTALTEKAA